MTLDADPTIRSEAARLLRLDRRRFGLALLVPAALGVGGLVCGHELGAVIGPYLAVVALSVLEGLARRNPWPREDPGVVEVRAGGLFVGGREVLRRAEVAQGHLRVRSDGGLVVVLEHRGMVRRHHPTELRVRDERAGRALLRAFGLDASESVARFVVPAPLLLDARRAVAGLAGLYALALGGFLGLDVLLRGLVPDLATGVASLLAVLPALALSLLAAVVVAPRVLRVGPDGIVMVRLGRQRYLSFEAIASVVVSERGFVLALRDGTALDCTLAGSGRRRDLTAAALCDAGRRIADALASYRERGGRVVLRALEPGTRDARVWLRDLLDLAAPQRADYRSLAIDPRRLWTVVEDPQSPPAQRAGAAVALGPGLDAAGRERLRVTAQATVAPRVRCVLEAVADARDEAVMVGALSELAERGR